MDAWTLFVSLDMDGDHTVSVEDYAASAGSHFTGVNRVAQL